MKSTASYDSYLLSQGLGQTTARARAAVARAVLCPPAHSQSLEARHTTRSPYGPDSGRDSQGSPFEHLDSRFEQQSQGVSKGQGQQEFPGQRNRQSQRHGHDGIQRNLLAPYTASKATSASRGGGEDQRGGGKDQRDGCGKVGYGRSRGQSLQALSEATSAAFQVGCVLILASQLYVQSSKLTSAHVHIPGMDCGTCWACLAYSNSIRVIKLEGLRLLPCCCHLGWSCCCMDCA